MFTEITGFCPMEIWVRLLSVLIDSQKDLTQGFVWLGVWTAPNRGKLSCRPMSKRTGAYQLAGRLIVETEPCLTPTFLLAITYSWGNQEWNRERDSSFPGSSREVEAGGGLRIKLPWSQDLLLTGHQ